MSGTTSYEAILEEMQQKYKSMAGFVPDRASDVGIRMQVLAHQANAMLERVDTLEQQVFAQTSTGHYLEMHAETRGLVRKKALHATGILRFRRESPAASDIAIAAGVLCATRPDPQVQFETTGEVILPAGAVEVDAPARAVEPGALGNVAPGSVCLMVTPAPGISAVANPAEFTGGVDAESDEALRQRLLRSFSSISNGTNCAFYYDIAMEHDKVASAAVLPRQRGRGTVDVIIAAHNQPDEGALAAAIQADMAARKEINVDVLVQPAVRDVADIRAEVSIGDGYDPDAVLESCHQVLDRFAAGLGVGAPLLLARLGMALLAVDGVQNYRILSPEADLVPEGSHLAQAGSISVTRMAVG